MFSSAAVITVALYLIGLSVVSLIVPARATAFLNGFAQSASAHYLELVLRLAGGAGLVLAAPRMLFSTFFALAGWVVVVTTMCLAFVPWQWHRRFAAWSVPHAVRRIRVLGVASLAIGASLLAAFLLGGR
jgi:uncharacterized protein YjeT (DUF2065 family)